MSRAILKQSSTQIVVEPMSERLGAEVSNIDLSIPLATELKEAVINAFHQYKVLFFRKQNLTPSQQIAVVQQFSDVLNIKAETNQQKISSKDNLFVHPFLPQKKGEENIWPVGYNIPYKLNPNARPMRSVSNGADGLPVVERGTGSWERENYTGTSANVWHADNTFLERPSSFTVLQAKRLPKMGGDTLFVDMSQAYDDLSDEMKEKIKNLKVIHDWRQTFPYFKRAVTDKQYKKLEQLFPPVAHPVVRTHNVTGVKSLYVNRTFATHLENQDQELYNFLADKASVPEYQIRFKWKSIGDIAMWDNRVLQHYAVNDYQGKDRLMEHTASLGEKVF